LGAQTVTGRYSALGLIACGVVGITVLSLLRPEYTRVFFTHPRGPGFLLTAVVLMIIGTIWVSRVIRVHY
jgi:tight adherence protein B